MPWVRLDEHALNHVKILAISDGAFRLWIEGLAHCQRHLTDGKISAAALKGFRYAKRGRVQELTTAIDRHAALWEADEDGYAVHDYLSWNDPRDKVIEERRKAQERYERFKKRQSNAVSNAPPNSVANDVTTGVHVHKYNTEDPPLKGAEDLRAPAPARPRAVQGSGAGAGTFPRDHLRCSTPCGRVCLPEQMFEQFVRQRGGPRDEADAYVRAWHRRVDEAWAEGGSRDGTPIGDDGFTFWRERWREDHPTTVTAKTTPAQRQFAPGTSTAELVAIARQQDAKEKAGRR